MKKSIMKRWVKALRSGKYKKTTARLKYNGRYCCLGVLCEISKLSKFDKYDRYILDSEVLPKTVIDWAGMNTCTGEFDEEKDALTELNDHGKSFKQLANIIEKNYKKL